MSTLIQNLVKAIVEIVIALLAGKKGCCCKDA